MNRLKRTLLILLALVLVIGMTACGGSGAKKGELNVYMWSDYMSDEVVKAFEDEYDIKVNFSYMNSSEEAVAKITSGGGDQYDLVMPCDADMTLLIEGGYLAEINLDNIPNFKNLGDAYKYRDFDPENKYAIPYFMNYVYVVYNTETCPIKITKYEDLLSPELEGQIASVTGIRNLFPIALVALGHDPNSMDAGEIEDAYHWLTKYMKNVKVLNSDDAEKELISGLCSVGFVFDGMAGRAFREMDNLVVADLTDAIQLGVDEFVIPAKAKNKENAELFLNWFLDAENMAANIRDDNAYTCPNDAAVALMDDDYRLDPSMDIPKHMKENYFLQLDVGEANIIYDEFWTMLLSQ